MKKIYLSIISFVMVLFLGANISATEVKTSSEKLSLDTKKAGFKVGVKSNVNSKADDAFDVLHSSLTVTREGGKYFLNYKQVNLLTPAIVSGDTIILKAYDAEDGIFVDSYYKKIGNNYAHISNIYSFVNGSQKISQQFNFLYTSDTVNCKYNGTDLKKANCVTPYYAVKSIITKTYVGTSNTVSTQSIAYYNKGAYYYSDYILNDFYKLINGRLTKYKRIEAPKNSSGYLTRVSDINYYSNGRASYITSYYGLDYSRRVSSFTYKSKTLTAYNTSGRMTSRKVIYNMERYSSGKWIKYYPVTLSESRTYYSNGRTRQITTYFRNTSNYMTGARKTVYRSNGKKYSYKSRSYSAGKVSRQYFYQYNSYGNTKGRGSYKISTYYSKGRATKAYKQKYRSNGKGYKAYRVKLTSGVVNF